MTNYHSPLQKVYRHHLRSYDIEAAAEAGCVMCSVLWSHLTAAERTLIRQEQGEPSLARDLAFSNPIKRWQGLNALDLGWYGWFSHRKETKIVFIFGAYASKVIEILLVPAGQECIPGSREYELRPPTAVWSQLEQGALGELVLRDWKQAIRNGTVKTVEDVMAQAIIPPIMDCPQNLDLMRSWDQQCDPSRKDHQYCHSCIRPATKPFPTRLLDVGSDSDTSPLLRLMTNHTERSALPYVTLSYTWGPNPDLEAFPLLRQWTLEIFEQGIDVEILPRLFQDAIQVTRKLGYRYLWIDALCILQDSTDDLRREIAAMGQIYQGSALNIAAGGSEDSGSPLFAPRSPVIVKPYKTKVDWRSVPGHLENTDPQEYFIFDADFLSHSVNNTRLNQRSWVLQEQLLSRRILHFGKQQLFWECLCRRSCETFPQGMLDFPAFRSESAFRYAVFDRLTKKHFWDSIVRRYSQCGITKIDDTLLAVSGLASVFGEIVGTGPDHYFAGIWGHRLLPSLLWHIADGTQIDGNPAVRPKQYLAPSWSWASVKGKIGYQWEDSTLSPDVYKNAAGMVSVSDIFVQPLDMNNPYGQVSDGYIKMIATLRHGNEFFWTWQTDGKDGRGSHNYNSRWAFHGGFRSFPNNPVYTCIFDDFQDYERRKVRGWLPTKWEVKDLWVLPLIQRPKPWWAEHVELPAVEGLLLAALPGGRDDEFQRIGYFMAKIENNSDDYEKPIKVFINDSGERREITIR